MHVLGRCCASSVCHASTWSSGPATLFEQNRAKNNKKIRLALSLLSAHDQAKHRKHRFAPLLKKPLLFPGDTIQHVARHSASGCHVLLTEDCEGQCWLRLVHAQSLMQVLAIRWGGGGRVWQRVGLGRAWGYEWSDIFLFFLGGSLLDRLTQFSVVFAAGLRDFQPSFHWGQGPRRKCGNDSERCLFK